MFSFTSLRHFGMASSSREANRKSQKLFPFVKVAGKDEIVPIHLKA